MFDTAMVKAKTSPTVNVISIAAMFFFIFCVECSHSDSARLAT